MNKLDIAIMGVSETRWPSTVYAPTADKDEHEIEEFYHQIEEVLKITKKHEITILMDDFNAKVGQMVTHNITGNVGLGERNQRERRLYTWKSPQDGQQGRIVRNQIDYILINQRFRNNIKDVKTYLGVDINSNHNLICSRIEIKLKKLTKPSKPNRICLDLLKNPQAQIITNIRPPKKRDSFNLHKKLKYTSGSRKPENPHLLRDANGNICDHEQQCKEWERYINDLFDDAAREDAIDTQAVCENETDRGPSILKSEVRKAIKQAKNNKVSGPDQIPTELLKLLEEENITYLTAFFNKIYNEGIIPDDWLESLFITIPKKSRPTKCSNFRLISLMSHTLKIFLRILQNRIFLLCESRMGDKQFGFRNGLGTREALFCMRVLIQKNCEFRKDVYICFIDFEKAFDWIQHDTLFEYLQIAGLDHYDISLLKYLYYNQEALEDRQEGVRVGGGIINNIRYADDTAILTENLEDLQTLVNLVNEASRRKGHKINISKTKWMAAGKRVLKRYVWSILLYGCETWVLEITMLNKLEAFEMWCYRRILKISWVSHTSNEDVLRMMNTTSVLQPKGLIKGKLS
ncbi:uncharacterized protein LOC143261929 [Megalopta genalis]|uniref:uncharacterized protein LOC143261929 n=1 Tax=Megalopta genalis TaxID=115081 RepID=UPI003FD5DA82